jgi:hypothetical protein
MGCFSFICPKCGKGINSTSFSGENVRLSLLQKGKVIEEMQGAYDSYGQVFDKDGDSLKWKMDWNQVCDLMFDHNKNNGICATHVFCNPDEHPTERSEDDPDQGWNKVKSFHKGKCEIYHKVAEDEKAPSTIRGSFNLDGSHI